MATENIDITSQVDYILNLTEQDYYREWGEGMYYQPEFDEYGNALPFKFDELNINIKGLDLSQVHEKAYLWELLKMYPQGEQSERGGGGFPYVDPTGQTTILGPTANPYETRHGSLFDDPESPGTGIYETLPGTFYYRGFKVVDGVVIEAPDDLTGVIVPGERQKLLGQIGGWLPGETPEYDTRRYPNNTFISYTDESGNTVTKQRFKNIRDEIDLTGLSDDEAILHVQNLMDVFYDQGEYGAQFRESDQNLIANPLVSEDIKSHISSSWMSLLPADYAASGDSTQATNVTMADLINPKNTNKISTDIQSSLRALEDATYGADYRLAFEEDIKSDIQTHGGVGGWQSSDQSGTIGSYTYYRPWDFNTLKWDHNKAIVEYKNKMFVEIGDKGLYDLELNPELTSYSIPMGIDAGTNYPSLDRKLEHANNMNLNYTETVALLSQFTNQPAANLVEFGVGKGIMTGLGKGAGLIWGITKGSGTWVWGLTKGIGRSSGKLTGILKKDTPIGKFGVNVLQGTALALSGYRGAMNWAWQNEYAPYGTMSYYTDVLDPFYDMKGLIENGRLDGFQDVMDEFMAKGMLNNMSEEEEQNALATSFNKYTSAYYPTGFNLWTDPTTSFDIIDKENKSNIELLLFDKHSQNLMTKLLQDTEGNMTYLKTIIDDMANNPEAWGWTGTDYSPGELYEAIVLYQSLDDIKAVGQGRNTSYEHSQISESYENLEKSIRNFYGGTNDNGEWDPNLLYDEMTRAQAWIMKMDQFLPNEKKFFVELNSKYVYGGIAVPNASAKDGRYGINQDYMGNDIIDMGKYMDYIMEAFNPHLGAEHLASFLTDEDGNTVNPDNLGYGDIFGADWRNTVPLDWHNFEGSAFGKAGLILPGTQNPIYDVSSKELNVNYKVSKFRLNHPSQIEVHWGLNFINDSKGGESISLGNPIHIENKEDQNALNAYTMWNHGFYHMFTGDNMGIKKIKKSESYGYDYYDYGGEPSQMVDLSLNIDQRRQAVADAKEEYRKIHGFNPGYDQVNPGSSEFATLINTYGGGVEDGDYVFNIGVYEFAKRLNGIYTNQFIVNRIKQGQYSEEGN